MSRTKYLHARVTGVTKVVRVRELAARILWLQLNGGDCGQKVNTLFGRDDSDRGDGTFHQ